MVGVIGSVNIDYVSMVNSFPKTGETIASSHFDIHFGGKGANQAIASSISAQSQTNLFCKINKNDQDLLNNLTSKGLSAKYISFSEKQTGNAFIAFSEKDKDNFIIINKCANDDFSDSDESLLDSFIDEHEFIIFQNEINEDFNDKAINKAFAKNKKIVLNPSPVSGIKKEWIAKTTYLVLNETELDELSNFSDKSIEEKIEDIKAMGCKEVILTLGSKGVYIGSTKETKPALKVNAVDTTAAGDTFTGAFVGMLDKNKTLQEAIEYGIRAAAVTVTKVGAQESIPFAKEI